ncbi:MAG TPA: c-type cytochrome [Gemmataceae bacterium]|nr:c-type cytochrome [Gemmataceae bacterium]
MAATDKPFRDQRLLDIVFAVSNILMLLSVFWMLWQDYAREYKVEMREFRKVEVGVAQAGALDAVNDASLEKEFTDKLATLKAAKEKLEKDENQNKLKEARANLASLKPKQERTEAAYQAVKADVDSITSFLYIAEENGDSELAKKYRAQLIELNKNLGTAQAERDKVVDEMKVQRFVLDDIEGSYTKAAGDFKKVNDKVDTQVKLAIAKRWTFADTVRALPVIDGFASPVKIQQYTINDVPIDYNFKYVTRFDRCTTCHLGIDRPAYSREKLEALAKEDNNFMEKGREKAIKLYDARVGKTSEGQDAKGNPVLDREDIAKVPNPHDITPVDVKSVLTPSRITEFAAHPRLDLFVGSNSKHPAEKFGCSSCHYGQGSGTSFLDASHSPNSSKTREEWHKDKGWEPAHMWDYPMLPHRFVESSCIKCHHEVTDLISTDNRVEAPKLIKGYNLIKEYGCFGCHEISGWKGPNRVGPDLRLEPTPPLEDLLPIEKVRAENDTDNRPGNMRKVGPALSRVSEKVSQSWMEKWIRSPSSFRPDTKMPHYYGLSNNREDELPKEQKTFPDTEIASIAHFLMHTSKTYVQNADKQHAADKKDPRAASKDETRLLELLNVPRLNTEQQSEVKAIKARMKYRKEVKLVDLAPKHKGDAAKGRLLFTERGCLACHTHQGTQTTQGSGALLAPGVHSEAAFGPDLSQVAEKLGGNTPEARRWLIQWILNPHVHSPRSRMPVTHLSPDEAADVAAWILTQPAGDSLGSDWKTLAVKQPSKEELQALAKVYLTRMLSDRDMEAFLKGMNDEQLAKYRKDPKSSSSVTEEWRLILGDIAEDEKALVFDDVRSEDALKFYLGKKAVGRLGCYACHDIPGFETAKSIGVGLNDWGKKPADRLAFEDIKNFYEKHYYGVDSLSDKDVKKDGKEPYEKFYAEALLDHHAPQRLGYLNQKIRDPRSYDFNRIRAWDDRSRMPKFTLGRPRMTKEERDALKDDATAKETMTRFEGRKYVEEAKAREAVATFVLGLVAEQVPTKSINTPTGDRLAEVKGRQILDKFNCAGCHTIRPGVYDFNLGDKTRAKLDFALEAQNNLIDKLGVIRFPNHTNWVGRNAVGDRLTAHAVLPHFRELLNANEEKEAWLVLTLSEALRYTDSKGQVQNIPSSTPIYISIDDLGRKASGIKSGADIATHFGATNPYGGAFSDLLVPYLNQRDPKKYPLNEGDSAEARASLPPYLMGQGERTQTDWLVRFLLDPQKVRKLAILRMPKFNMSKEEAQAIADYFAGVTRQTNPGVSLPYPIEPLPQQDDLDGTYWRKKTADYLAHLKVAPAVDMDGVLIKGKTAYQQRLDEYKPVWEKLSKAQEGKLNEELQKLKDASKARKSSIEEKQKALKKDEGKKADLQKEIDLLETAEKNAQEDEKRLQGEIKKLDVASLQKRWEEDEAYAADAYRMLTSRKMCLQCHQVGSYAPSEKDKQGPPLALASSRLRPGWLTQWINQPQRFVPYSSLMPTYFSEKEQKWQPIHSGPALEQIHALRDALINYPRISEMPINRIHNPDAPADKK